MVQIEPLQPGSSGYAPKGPATFRSTPSAPSAPASSSMPFPGAEDTLHYAPGLINTLATGITAHDLHQLITEAMERAEGADDGPLQGPTRHQDAPRTGHADVIATPHPPRRLSARQYNSHKRSRDNRKKKKHDARGIEGVEGVLGTNGGGVEEGEEPLSGGALRRQHKKKRKETERASEEMGAREGGDSASCRGVKRTASATGPQLPKRRRVNPSLPPATIPPPPSTQCAHCRHRCQVHALATKRPGTGYWASDYVRTKVAREASIRRLGFDMGAALKAGGQWGSYRPKVERLDERMERLTYAMKEALAEGTERGVRGFLDKLVHAEGYRLFEWDGIHPTLLADTEDRVFAVLVGQPDHPSWRQRCERLFDLMQQDAPRFAALPKKKTNHRRGAYPSIDTGVTFAPGSSEAHNLRLEAKEKNLLHQSEQRELRGHIQRFVETAFSLFAPHLYGHYAAHMHKLRTHPDYQDLDYEDPYGAFFCMSVNSGPKVVTVPHRDVMNLAHSWCAVVALGRFQPHLGGHLILHDLRLAFCFLPGSVVLFPSAFLWHSNAPIRKEDQRASITFYSAGALFRFIDNSFMTETQLEDQDPEEHRRREEEKDRSAATAAGLYSRVSEVLSPLSSTPPSPAPSSPLSSPPPSSPSPPLLPGCRL